MIASGYFTFKRGNELVKRYEWEDALVDAQAAGHISNGALMLCLKLARAINWSPKDKRPAGLYWKNTEALKQVGSSRAQYFKHRSVLFELGFFTEDNGNLLPQVPDLSLLETKESPLETENDEEVSLLETEQSPVETKESPLETQESPVDNPLSVDIFSEDVLSVDTSSVKPTDCANAPSVLPSLTSKDKEGGRDINRSLTAQDRQAVSLTDEVIEPESLVETDPLVYEGHRYSSRSDIDALMRQEKALAVLSEEW
jgi:hypothetical protein